MGEKQEEKQEKKITLEERFENLEEIITRMEEDEVPLDQAFDLYKSGLEEVQAANSMLEAIEKAMLVMNQAGELEEF